MHGTDQNCHQRKVEEWTEEVKTLSDTEFAKTQPHAAYAAFIHGLSSKWNCVMDLEALSASKLPLESAIYSHRLHLYSDRPKSSGRLDLGYDSTSCSPIGGLGVPNPMTSSWDRHGLKADQCPSGGTGSPLGPSTIRLPCSPAVCKIRSMIHQTNQSGRRYIKGAGTATNSPAELHGPCPSRRKVHRLGCLH